MFIPTLSRTKLAKHSSYLSRRKLLFWRQFSNSSPLSVSSIFQRHLLYGSLFWFWRCCVVFGNQKVRFKPLTSDINRWSSVVTGNIEAKRHWLRDWLIGDGWSNRPKGKMTSQMFTVWRDLKWEYSDRTSVASRYLKLTWYTNIWQIRAIFIITLDKFLTSCSFNLTQFWVLIYHRHWIKLCCEWLKDFSWC